MNKITILIIIAITFIAPSLLKAQSTNDSIYVSVNPYASFRGNLTAYKNEIELQDNVSRLGINGNIKKGKISFLVSAEVHLNLFQGGGTFNVDNNGNADFLEIQTLNNQQTITNRLGYIGIDIEKYGTFTFGKQWSVYYDVSSYTNQFTVFGGRASATYIGGTDGGENGTGRVNQAAIYRNKFGPFYLGAQVQLLGFNNNKFIDGYGFSGQLEITKQITLGAAYNKALVSDSLIINGRILGLHGQPSYLTTAIKYQDTRFTLSLLGAVEKNGDFAQGSYMSKLSTLQTPTVVFDAKGLEIFSNYSFNKFSIHAGYNLYVPDTKAINEENNQPPISQNFKVNDIIFGANYVPFNFIEIYAEQRFSYGRTAANTKDPSVFALGMIIDFSKTFKKTIYPKN